MSEDRQTDNVLQPRRRTDRGSGWPLAPSIVSLLAGAWLLLAPTLLGYSDEGVNAAFWNDRTVGPVALASIWAERRVGRR
jgi:hypothetical protein